MNMTEKPKDKQKVFALMADGSVVVHYWSDNNTERRMFLMGNIFADQETAEREKQRRLMSAMRQREETKEWSTLQIESDSEDDYLIVNNNIKVGIKKIMNMIECWQQCIKQCQEA